jgi:hypothetical protein
MFAKRSSLYAQNGVSSAFSRKNTPFLARSYDSMQCFQFSKKTRCVSWNIQLRSPTAVSECFRIFNNNQHNVPSRKVIKNLVPRVPYGQLGLICDSGRLPPYDAYRERVRRFIIAYTFCETMAPMCTVYKQAIKVMKKFPNKITIFHRSVHHDPVTCLGRFGLTTV